MSRHWHRVCLFKNSLPALSTGHERGHVSLRNLLRSRDRQRKSRVPCRTDGPHPPTSRDRRKDPLGFRIGSPNSYFGCDFTASINRFASTAASVSGIWFTICSSCTTARLTAFDRGHSHSKAASGYSHGQTVSHRSHQAFFQVGRIGTHTRGTCIIHACPCFSQVALIRTPIPAG